MGLVKEGEDELYDQIETSFGFLFTELAWGRGTVTPFAEQGGGEGEGNATHAQGRTGMNDSP